MTQSFDCFYIKPSMIYNDVQIFLSDPNFPPPIKRKTKGDHIRENCEMCNLLGGGKICFQMERSARWRQANEASEAYRNQPDLV